MSDEEGAALLYANNQLARIVAWLMSGLVVIVGFFLVRFIDATDDHAVEIKQHEQRIAKLESVTATLTLLAEKYDVKLEKIDDRMRSERR